MLENFSTQIPGTPSASVQMNLIEPGSLIIKIDGRLDSNTTGKVWRESTRMIETTLPKQVTVDASNIDYCDGSGIGLLVELRRRQRKTGGEFDLRGLREEFQQLMDLFASEDFEETVGVKPGSYKISEEIGRASVAIWDEIISLIAFVGEASTAILQAFLNPRQVRWKDVFLTAEIAGVNALPIIALVSFLIGLIMAFQASIPMRQFGAEVFVANLIGLSMVRELGPLMTAIVLTGRSGSAFAAELGTMKINEEIDALTTMGLDPVRFLVVPRLIAVLIMTPLLAVFADIVGIAGGSIVLLALGYPLATYINQILSSVNYIDFLGGLFKSFVFGLLVAGIGCLKGLQTKTGATAVGESTTSAVVVGIILIVVTDGIFSVVFYYLGI